MKNKEQDGLALLARVKKAEAERDEARAEVKSYVIAESQSYSAYIQEQDRAEKAEAGRERHWSDLCEVVRLLGKVVPEAAVDAPGWVRAEVERREKAEAEVERLRDQAQRAEAVWRSLYVEPLVEERDLLRAVVEAARELDDILSGPLSRVEIDSCTGQPMRDALAAIDAAEVKPGEEASDGK